MIERIFVGWERPTLPIAVRIIHERCARGGAWEGHSVRVVVPGAQAARRLARLCHEAAAETHSGAPPPEILTPAAFLDRCHTPDRRIATSAEAHFAWLAAARSLDGADRRVLAPAVDPDTDGPMAWGAVAAQARELRDAVAAECRSIADVAAQCHHWDGFQADRRWSALVRLEQAYLETLAAAGRTDRNDALRAVAASGEIACERPVCLVGVQDLNGLERAMLRTLSSPVCALIPAPDSEQDGFDELGALHAAAWHDRPVPIQDARLHFVSDPAEEAGKVCDLIAALSGRYGREEITVGVGDETSAEGLSLRLAAAGLAAFSPFGRFVARTRPAVLLLSLRDYLRDSSASSFATLVRHPDLEHWLETFQTDQSDSPFLCHLDLFLAERLLNDFSSLDSLPHFVGAAPEGQGATRSLDRVRAGRDAVASLLTPLRAGQRPIASWAQPIADVLGTVYGDQPVEDGTPGGKQLGRSLTCLASTLAGLKRLPPSLAPEVSVLDALAFVLADLDTYRLPSDDADEGVEMMGWLELPLDDAPVLLLTGLHEGCVPKNTGDDPLLPDSMRARLGLVDDRRRQARETFLLRILLESRADVQLVVSRRGADGSPKMPSRLLFACDAPTAAARARRFAGRVAVTPRPLFAPGSGRHLPLPPVGHTGLQGLRVTGFRDYITCPYRFYLRHVLNLKAPDDSRDEMDARLFGTLLHDCLDGFAHSAASDCADPDRIRDFLRGELRRQVGHRFGARPSSLLELQIRQADRRLTAFADWQAQSVQEGWRIEPDLAEQDMTALLIVDDQDFVITGRPDRVDYCPQRGFRIIDYKTGDTGKSPDERHRSRVGTETRWIDLQLPLYRRLLEAQGKPVAPGEVGYVLLSADLAPIGADAKGRGSAGIGFVRVPWAEEDYADALQCAEDVIRRLQAGVFWPPTDPPPFPPSRSDFGRTDPFSGLCLDSCADRAEWLGLRR